MSWEVSTMRCGMSFFNAAVFKNCLKRYWPVWAALLLSLILSLPLPVMNMGDGFDAADLIRTVGGYGSIVTTFLFSGMAAMTVFGWMYNAKSVGFTASLPIKREGLFLSCALAGFTMVAAPAVVTALLTPGHWSSPARGWGNTCCWPSASSASAPSAPSSRGRCGCSRWSMCC